MSGKIEKQGKRPGYIVGGIFAVILAAFLVMLYVPDLLTALFGIDKIWDLSATFNDVFGENVITMINAWGVTAVLLVFVLVYFVCLFARPSTSSTLFRLSALSGAMALLVPALFNSLKTITNDGIDLTGIGGYVLFGLFVVSFVLYIAGIVARIRQKYHKNRSSTVLVFTATFWMLLPLFPALNVLNGIMKSNIEFFATAGGIVTNNPLGFIAVYLVISAIWLFVTYPHRVVVDYNPDTRNRNAKGRPQVMQGDGVRQTLTLEELERDNTAQNTYSPRANVPQQDAPRFAHNYTAQNAPTSFGSNIGEQPYSPQPQQRPIVQQPMQNNQFAQQQFNQNPYAQQPRPNTPTFTQAPQNSAQTPSFTTPRPANPNNMNVNAQNPYASFNNFAQNNPYNRPMAQQPQQPRVMPSPAPQNPYNVQQQRAPYSVPPRPAMQQPMPNQQRPINQPVQAQRPMAQYPQNPAQRPAPRPPVTPFTSGNPAPAQNPSRPNNNGTNGNNGTPPSNNGF